jgi:phospholipid/cholesterol/gamma-HCH transport system ATP-binding protein
MAYGSFMLMRDLNFVVRRGDIFIIMGGSGCGKSTLLRHLIGLKDPATGEIVYGDVNFTRAEPEQRERLLRRFGILYQSGALWNSMTLAEKHRPAARRVHRSHAAADSRNRRAQARAGRAQGLRGLLPQPDQRRDAEALRLARAMALDPDVLFFDLDDLILELRANSRRDDRGSHPRVGQHFHDRQQVCLSGRGVPNPDRDRRSA